MSRQLKINKPAPDFSLSDTNNHIITLSDYENTKIVLLVLNRGLMCPH